MNTAAAAVVQPGNVWQAMGRLTSTVAELEAVSDQLDIRVLGPHPSPAGLLDKGGAGGGLLENLEEQVVRINRAISLLRAAAERIGER